jgi:hypothetical protein
MRKTVILSLVAIALLAFSCTSVRKTMSMVGVQNVELQPLGPDQYEILGEVEGYGEATRFLIFGATMNKFSDIPGVEGKAAGKAMYNAISMHEGADVLLAPKYDTEVFDALIFKKAKVKVKAKAVRIITK